MDAELICNFKKCRKPIQNAAWVTSCSLCEDIFCLEDGERAEIAESLVCPACNTKLEGRHDIVKIDMNPTDQYKATVLAGMNPDTIMEVASRALSFWVYQVQQELNYKEGQAAKLAEQRDQVQEFYKQDIQKWQTEISHMNKELESSKAEVVNQKKRTAELSEKLMDKSRQLQRIQTMYDGLRRKLISPLNCNAQDRNARPPERPFALPTTTPDLYKHKSNLAFLSVRHAPQNPTSKIQGRNFTYFDENGEDSTYKTTATATGATRHRDYDDDDDVAEPTYYMDEGRARAAMDGTNCSGYFFSAARHHH